MAIGIRTRDLRKVDTSAPPAASHAAAFGASEGLRPTLAPQFPHLPLPLVLAALLGLDLLLMAAGLSQLHGRAVS